MTQQVVTEQTLARRGEYRKIVVDGLSYYGKHLMLTALGCSDALLDKQAIATFLRDLVPAIDMKTYGAPVVERFGEGIDTGISAVQLIETSAITVHTNDMARDMYLDVFSCKGFSEAMVVDFVRAAFAPSEINHTVVLRR